MCAISVKTIHMCFLYTGTYLLTMRIASVLPPTQQGEARGNSSCRGDNIFAIVWTVSKLMLESFLFILKKTYNYLTAMTIFLIVNKLEISDLKFYVPTRSVPS